MPSVTLRPLTPIPRVLLIIALALTLAMPIAPALQQAQALAAAPLRSPWDALPAKKISKRPPPDCPSSPVLPRDLETASYYDDAARSHIDPARQRAYEAAVKPLQSAVRKVETMADRYRSAGDDTWAACAATWLADFASTAVLSGTMGGNQSVYVQGWMLGGLSVAWLKIRAAQSLPDSARQAVPVWLADLASMNLAYYAGRDDKRDGRNNHRYWAGFAVMAAGIAADRKDLYNWGVASFHVGIDQITPEGQNSPQGMLPLELDRRARALHYHLFAAAPLVMIAELADANGLDLYSEKDHALRRLVHVAIAGIDNPAPFAASAGVEQEPIPIEAGTLAWAIPFERRFPDEGLHALLDRLTSRSVTYLGGLPPG